MHDPSLVELLRLCARIDAEEDRFQWLSAARSVDWTALPAAAEAHGLGPLAYHHLSSAGLPVPIDTRQQLFASAIHHRDENESRIRALAEILDAFHHAGIRVLVLKGVALAHILYPTVGLRPFADVDLLVESRHAWRAQSVLAQLGFIAPSSPSSRQLVSHHHLPAAIRQRDGHVMHVEIHVDALSRDTPGSLSMDDLTSAPQPFSIDGRTAYALGHADMLYHLCRHTAEGAPLLRLIWVADVVGYAARFHDVIPWADVKQRYPFVLNALSLLHLLTPLPDELLHHVTPARGDGLRGIGVVCKPLGDIVRNGRALKEICRDLFDPSDWWLRLHYGVPADRSLAWHRWVEHPSWIARWLMQRAFDQFRWAWQRNVWPKHSV